MATETQLSSIRIHKVGTYDSWKTLYQGGSIGTGDLVVIPPTELINILPSQSGNSGKYLTTNGSALSWATVDALPSQTSQSGKFLTTNGSAASWANIPTEIPSQSGQSGKFLTTNGSAVSWDDVPAGLPSQTGNSGKYLTTDGTDASWGASSSVTTMGIGTANGLATLNQYGRLSGAQAASKTFVLGLGQDIVPTIDGDGHGYHYDITGFNENCYTIIVNFDGDPNNVTISKKMAITLPSLANFASLGIDYEIEFVNYSGNEIWIDPATNELINGANQTITCDAQYKSVILKVIPTGSNSYEWNAQGAIS